MKTLYLHIGHGKTGTSFIQSSLAISINHLSNAGILYPIGVSSKELGLAGHISSGNASDLMTSVETFDNWLKSFKEVPEKKILASSEYMFHHLRMWMDEERPSLSLAKLEELCRSNNIETVKILLFVRNPLTFIPSNWQQAVKRAGSIAPLRKFAETQGAYEIKLAAEISRKLSCSHFFNLRVVNYDKRRKDILTEVEDWLCVEQGTLDIPKSKAVNRSLTFGELELQRHLNGLLGTSNFLSDRLCNELPSIIAEHYALPEDTAEVIWLDALTDIEAINQHLSSSEALEFYQAPGPSAPESFMFNSEQLALVASIIAEKHLRSTASIEERNRAVAERDLAITDRDRVIKERDYTIAERDRAVAERSKIIAERDRAFADIDARRSKLAEFIDRLDYETHVAISKLPFISHARRQRFFSAAQRRKREKYNR